MNSKKILILGAGIQGICCALALYKKGYDVTLLDKCSSPMNRTSVRGEAKIHLGYVYANDITFKTANLLINAAMNFAPLLDEWTDHRINWSEITSNPFNYLVVNDSMVPADQLALHYEKISKTYKELKGNNLHYLGDHIDNLVVKEIPVPNEINKKAVLKTFQTSEKAIQTKILVPILVAALKENRVKLRMNETVRSVKKISNGFEIEIENDQGGKKSLVGDIVVNCLWDGRLAVDASLNLLPERDWVYRLKYRFLGNLRPPNRQIGSYTLVLGPYGDVVTYKNGLTYLSWYPECMRGWSQELHPPEEWESISSIDKSERHQHWIKKSISEFSNIIPALSNFDVQQIDAGIIFSWGKTDIDDPVSLLHKRYNIGVTSYEGYFSIDTGKFTSAPLFASLLSKMI